MSSHAESAYLPLNTLKPAADHIWIVDGPLIRFGPRFLRMPFPTRMTVIQIGCDLLIHSPTPLAEPLRSEIVDLGAVRWLIAPNRLHYWWMPDWHAAFPDADVYLAPKVREQASSRIDFGCRALDRDHGYPWDKEVATLPVEGSYLTEVVFFHRPSRTLVLTDFIENFESRKLGSWLMRWLTRVGGVQDPDGAMPRDMRMTYTDKARLREAIETMIGWNPERIILAHGRWYKRNGADELRRAFQWLLGRAEN